jgi:hypothetical protein
MSVSALELNRATLARQLLLRREALEVGDAVRRVVALQAQQPASPYVALWKRLTAFDPAGLDAAFAGYTLVKATLMRLTLHAVHADDHPAMHQALQPTLRGSRLGDRRFTASGLSAADADALVPDLLEFAAEPTGAGSSRLTTASWWPGRTVMCCRRYSSMATSPGCGAQSRQESKPPHSTGCPTRPGQG